MGDKALMRACARFVPILLWSCASSGPYGFSHSYTPLDEETQAAQASRPYDPVMCERVRTECRQHPVSMFGVVTARKPGKDGAASLMLSLRTLADRNLCENSQDDSCRVTVSEREHGVVRVLLKLGPSDEIGATSVGPGSLLRVIGQLTDEVDPSDGTPVVRATYYRHWPRNYYVTDAARAQMRR